jgi:hypothetical protein
VTHGGKSSRADQPSRGDQLGSDMERWLLQGSPQVVE